MCSKLECRQEYRQRSQADWRKRHPGYFIRRRARERAARDAKDPVDPPRLVAPLSALPWDMAQEEFGVAGADFLGSMGRLLLVRPKDEMETDPLGSPGEVPKVAPGLAKDEMRGQPSESTGEPPQVAAGAAKDEIRAVPG